MANSHVGACAGSRYPFLTSKERDVETGLDYFLARYYSSSQGRFTSADSFGGSTLNPQTLNLYAYTKGNPLRFVDPSGHYAESAHGQPIPAPRGGGGCDLPGRSGCLWMGQGQKRPTATKPQAPPGYEIRPDGSLAKTGGGAVIKESVNVNAKRGVFRTVLRGVGRILGGAGVHILGEMIDPQPTGGGNADIGFEEYKFAWDRLETFLDQRFSPERLSEDTVFYRVFSDPDRMVGMYLTEQYFTSSSSARRMLAVSPKVTPNTATHIVAVIVPSGTIIARGQAAPQRPEGQYPGGGSQILIPNPRDPRIQWVNPHPLGP